ncbi:unnamed protein product, partial [Laminaria digitata]
DAHQIPPIVIGALPESRLEHLVHQSPLWRHVTVTTLRESVRMGGDPEYSDLVDALCTGTWPHRSPDGMSLLPAWMARVQAGDDVIDFAFPRLDDPGDIAQGAIMCSTHAAADVYNDNLYARISGPEVEHKAFDLVDPDHDYVSDERLELHRSYGVPPRTLRLRQGAVYGIMRNLSPALAHHTLVTVVSWTANLVAVRVIREGVVSETVDFIPRINFEFDLRARLGSRVVRRQSPLYFYGATTINSCQGRTLDRAVVDHMSPPFDHGHVGVQFSRVRSRDAFRVRSDESSMVDGRVPINNIVVPTFLV